MAELAAVEDKLLKVVTSWGRKENWLQKFAKSRQEVRDMWSEETSGHPNAVYFLVKAFTHHWLPSIHSHLDLQNVFAEYKADRPTESDLQGTMAAILRLQRVYDLPVDQMYAGNYSGYVGPALSPLDAYEVGKQAFMDGMLDQSDEWLRLAVDEMRKVTKGEKQPPVDSDSAASTPETVYTVTQMAAALGMWGRVQKYKGNDVTAEELCRESLSLDSNQADVKALVTELSTMPGPIATRDKDVMLTNMKHLCSRPRNHRVKRLKTYHICRFKPSLFLPYLRYKEEILAVQPYVSLFYDVIYDAEIESMKNWARNELTRASFAKIENNYVRTSDLTWLWDTQHPVAVTLSARVKDITWLEVKNKPGGPFSSEAFQVVNYGLGGHYSAHFDIITNPTLEELQHSGIRISTFLLYLTDVEMGGYTVFLSADISVAPVKGMALFWYNVDPAQKQEDGTMHAGCPVIKGHKWIANKWIWTHGNTYRRPCGPSPDSSQLDVENITKSRRRHIPLTN